MRASGTIWVPIHRLFALRDFMREGRVCGLRGKPDPHGAARERSEEAAVLIGADALVLLPRGEGELPAGAPVRYLRL